MAEQGRTLTNIAQYANTSPPLYYAMGGKATGCVCLCTTAPCGCSGPVHHCAKPRPPTSPATLVIVPLRYYALTRDGSMLERHLDRIKGIGEMLQQRRKDALKLSKGSSA